MEEADRRPRARASWPSPRRPRCPCSRRARQLELAARPRAASPADTSRRELTGLCCGRNRKSSKVLPTNRGSISAMGPIVPQGRLVPGLRGERMPRGGRGRPARLDQNASVRPEILHHLERFRVAAPGRPRVLRRRAVARREQHPRVPVLTAGQRALDQGTASRIPVETGARAIRPRAAGPVRRAAAPRRPATAPSTATGETRSARTARPPRGIASTSWSITACGCPFTQRRSSLSSRRRREATVSNESPSALTCTSALRGSRGPSSAASNVIPVRGRGAGRRSSSGAAGSGSTKVRRSPSPAAAAPGQGTTSGAKGGTKAWKITARPASARRQRPPSRRSVCSRSSGGGSPLGMSGVSTHATFWAKRTSSSSGSGQ